MVDNDLVTVLVSRELLDQMGDWSPPVQVKIIDRGPDSSQPRYTMIARTVAEP